MTATRAPAAPRLREPSQRVSPRARLMWATGGAVSTALLAVGLLVASALLDRFQAGWWAWVLLALWGVVEVVLMPLWRYAVHRWEVTDTAVYTQTGWWAIERRIAPMSRIQTVDYAEGVVERLFRLASVTVTTASAAGALSISGLDRPRARALVDQLTAQAEAVAGDAT